MLIYLEVTRSGYTKIRNAIENKELSSIFFAFRCVKNIDKIT